MHFGRAKAFGLLVVTLMLTACSGSGDAVPWMDKVCDALATAGEEVSKKPNLDQSSPRALVEGLSGFLAAGATTLDHAAENLKAAGPSPIQGGDDAVNKITTAFGSASKAFQEAKSKIEQADTSNAESVAATLPEAAASLKNVPEDLKPLETLKSNPDLEAAYAKADNCRRIDALENRKP